MPDLTRSQLSRRWLGQETALALLCACILFTSQLTNPLIARSDQSSVLSSPSSIDQSNAADIKIFTKPHKEPPPFQSATQDSKITQPKAQIARNDESNVKKESGEEEGEKEKERTGRKAVSSLILTIKLALLEDPRVFPYEIEVEVEAGSDEVTLAGKVSTETEKAAAAKIASMVPMVNAVSNKLEVVKELSEFMAHKQDDIITRHVKERFAKSATVTAANFDVRTEQGVVSLSGTVRFQVIVLEAAEAARHVLGVKAVKTDKVRIESEG